VTEVFVRAIGSGASGNEISGMKVRLQSISPSVDARQSYNIHNQVEPTLKRQAQTKTIVLAETAILRTWFKHLLTSEKDFKVIAETSDGSSVLEKVRKLRPRILLLGLALPFDDAMEIIREIRRETKTRIVVVSIVSDEPHVLEALKNGVSGYVSKQSRSSEIIEAIRAVANGRVFVSPIFADCIRSASLETMLNSHRNNFDQLTSRQTELVQMLAEGNTNCAIAKKVGLSPRTIECNRAELMKKLGLKSRTDLVRYAIRKKLIVA
jgi:DNA-binding NarL/FixJ family response regulator